MSDKRTMNRDTLAEKISFWAHIRFGIDDEPEWAHDLADDILDAIEPASAVPTEEQRAAVGRLVDAVQQTIRAKNDWMSRLMQGKPTTELDAATAGCAGVLQPGDIEVARAVAEGGK